MRSMTISKLRQPTNVETKYSFLMNKDILKIKDIVYELNIGNFLESENRLIFEANTVNHAKDVHVLVMSCVIRDFLIVFIKTKDFL